MNIPASKIRGPFSRVPEYKMMIFLKTTATILIIFKQFMEIISQKELHRWYLQEKNDTCTSSPYVKC
jgi:hypothetical protein